MAECENILGRVSLSCLVFLTPISFPLQRSSGCCIRFVVEKFAGVTVDKSFDVWSLGMAILHLYLGRGYFHGSSDAQVRRMFHALRGPCNMVAFCKESVLGVCREASLIWYGLCENSRSTLFEQRHKLYTNRVSCTVLLKDAVCTRTWNHCFRQ